MRTTDELTPREREVIKILSAAAPSPVPSDEISRELFGESANKKVDRSGYHAVRVIVHRIRAKRPEIKIETVLGVGYVIDAKPCPACGGDGWVKA